MYVSSFNDFSPSFFFFFFFVHDNITLHSYSSLVKECEQVMLCSLRNEQFLSDGLSPRQLKLIDVSGYLTIL